MACVLGAGFMGAGGGGGGEGRAEMGGGLKAGGARMDVELQWGGA